MIAALRRIWACLRAVPGWAWALVAGIVAGAWARSRIGQSRAARAALEAERRNAEATERAAHSVAEADAQAERRRRRIAAAERREYAEARRRATEIATAAARGHDALADELNRAMDDTDPDVAARTEDTQP